MPKGFVRTLMASSPVKVPEIEANTMIDVTKKAANQAVLLMEMNDFDPAEAGLRLAVSSGGCSGLEYDMDLVENPEDNDRIFESNGVRVFCDPRSYLYVNGTTIGYQDSLTQSGFTFDNPNAKRSCGCGTSFSA